MPHHALHLSLVSAAVAADRLLDPRRRVLGALDAGRRGRDERGAARLPDGERDAGVGTHEGLLERDGVWRMLPNERGDPVEDRPEPASGRSRGPVRQHPKASALRRPSLSWTIPYPHAAVPGSMPRTFTSEGTDDDSRSDVIPRNPPPLRPRTSSARAARRPGRGSRSSARIRGRRTRTRSPRPRALLRLLERGAVDAKGKMQKSRLVVPRRRAVGREQGHAAPAAHEHRRVPLPLPVLLRQTEHRASTTRSTPPGRRPANATWSTPWISIVRA